MRLPAIVYKWHILYWIVTFTNTNVRRLPCSHHQFNGIIRAGNSVVRLHAVQVKIKRHWAGLVPGWAAHANMHSVLIGPRSTYSKCQWLQLQIYWAQFSYYRKTFQKCLQKRRSFKNITGFKVLKYSSNVSTETFFRNVFSTSCKFKIVRAVTPLKLIAKVKMQFSKCSFKHTTAKRFANLIRMRFANFVLQISKCHWFQGLKRKKVLSQKRYRNV